MANIQSVCVYCGSAEGDNDAYSHAARTLGTLIADRGWGMVYGGGRLGLMGICADACIAAGGSVTGIIPDHLAHLEVEHPGLAELLVVDSMHTRKRLMAERSDAFVILPGGLGTLDETFEIITWRQLGLHDKPVVLINIGGFWDPLISLIEAQSDAGFIRPPYKDLFRVIDAPDALPDLLAREPDPALPNTALKRS